MRALEEQKGRRLNSNAKLLIPILAAAAFFLNLPSAAESPESAADTRLSSNPVAEVRDARSWELGPFVNWGTGVGNRSDFKFLWAGMQLAKPLSPVVHAGIFSGQFEFGGNVMPLWLGFTPPAHIQTFIYQGQIYTAPVGGGLYKGVSITPVIFRWNFLTRSPRFQPWFQAAGGLVYTTHKYPPDVLVPHGTPGGTSVWNFSPQGGIGTHYFLRPRRSIDL
jgi:lipid A 3-O-deacylase